MKDIKIEQMLRAWGANGLYRGFWLLIEILEQMQTGADYHSMIWETAKKEGISVSVVRKRIDTMLSKMKRQQTEEFVAAFGDADHLKTKECVERMAVLISVSNE